VASSQSDEIDILQAAALAGRSAETIRRWVWSGRLKAHKRGNKLMIGRPQLDELMASAGIGGVLTLREWLAELQRSGLKRGASEQSAADLVLDDRRQRS
jgi:excisionase family DNA binding protein